MKAATRQSAILGAAFLMATSAVGPGFLTQTTLFTKQSGANFGFVILVSILLDLGAQLNIWRVIAVSGKRAPELAGGLLPGLGHLLTALIVFGGFAFNIGNIGGAALGLNVLTGWGVPVSALLSGAVAVALFEFREAGRAMDEFVKWLGLVMIGLTIYVVFAARPPMAEALTRTFWPTQINAASIVTVVGGTVGGYISFAGAHRLIDAGVTGPEALAAVNRGALRGILLTSLIRVLLFLGALGVVAAGVAIDGANPAASVFRGAAGEAGYRLFGVMMWSAAMTSVVGAAYTSVTFLQTVHPWIQRHAARVTSAFIIASLAVFTSVGQPVRLLVWAGYFNGLILPLALGVILWAGRAQRQPVWLQASGWIVVAALTLTGLRAQFVR